MMGRKTLESLPRLLPGRTSLVISKDSEPGPGGHTAQTRSSSEGDFGPNYGKLIFTSRLEDALTIAAGDPRNLRHRRSPDLNELALPRADRCMSRT